MKKYALIKKLNFFTWLLLLHIPSYAQLDIEWERNYGGISSDHLECIQQTADQGFIMSGRSSSVDGDVGGNYGGVDYWILKTDESGEVQWNKNIGGTEGDFGYCVQQTADLGYIFIGGARSEDIDATWNNGLVDVWVVKLSPLGEIEWEQNYGGSKEDYGHYIQQTTDGGYIIAGITESDDGDVGNHYGEWDYWVLKLDEFGNLEWERNYGGSLNDRSYEIKQTVDGGYIIAGDSRSSDGDVGNNYGDVDFWIVKLMPDGEIEWEQNYGGSFNELTSTIVQTADGGYITAGGSRSYDGDLNGGTTDGMWDLWVVKLSATGALEWQKEYGGTNFESALALLQAPDGGYLVGGHSHSLDGDVTGVQGLGDYWILKLDESGDLIWQKTYGGSDDDDIFDMQLTADGGFIVVGESDSEDGDVTSHIGFYDAWVIKFAPLFSNVLTVNESPEFKVHPNPSTGDFSIYLDDVQGLTVVQVYDFLGVKVYEKNSTLVENRISGLGKGVYIVRIVREDGLELSRKVLVH